MAEEIALALLGKMTKAAVKREQKVSVFADVLALGAV